MTCFLQFIENRWRQWKDGETQLDMKCPMDAKISKYTEKLLNSEIMAVKTRRQEHKKALDEAKKELSKYDDTSKAEKGQG